MAMIRSSGERKSLCKDNHFPSLISKRYYPNIAYLTCLVSCIPASVVQWSDFLAADPEIPGAISGATRFSE
jgi:hypothetical protein